MAPVHNLSGAQQFLGSGSEWGGHFGNNAESPRQFLNDLFLMNGPTLPCSLVIFLSRPVAFDSSFLSRLSLLWEEYRRIGLMLGFTYG